MGMLGECLPSMEEGGTGDCLPSTLGGGARAREGVVLGVLPGVGVKPLIGVTLGLEWIELGALVEAGEFVAEIRKEGVGVSARVSSGLRAGDLLICPEIIGRTGTIGANVRRAND